MISASGFGFGDECFGDREFTNRNCRRKNKNIIIDFFFILNKTRFKFGLFVYVVDVRVGEYVCEGRRNIGN